MGPEGGPTEDDPASNPANGKVVPAAEAEAEANTPAEPVQTQASPQDIEAAKTAPPVDVDPKPAPKAEVEELHDLVLTSEVKTDGPLGPEATVKVEAKVAQWQPDWVQYDKYYRPLIFNPYPDPMKVVYDVGGQPRIVIIEPFGRVVTEVAQAGSYNFSAIRLNAFGIPIDLAVGNFFGGGYVPGPGQPPPPPPPPVRTLNNVPVQVQYTNATYAPMVVKRVVDVGPDPTNNNMHKVLLDGVTPAWGEWKQNEQGVPQFQVQETQSFPGMEAPGEGPLPGNYDLKLVSDSKPTGLGSTDFMLIAGAALVAVVAVGAILMSVLGKRRRAGL
ncbi:hypothetical protein ACIA48_19630 [Mycobacterium sp. NPDC051804]|uniref:hypothetical protein n=1 Tax=Mycobacterium sp. NPDC051804 TaxID=3364295 RepID=UPI0037AACCE6